MQYSELFYELIRVAIGRQQFLSRGPSAEEWKGLYNMAEKQALLGVCFVGVRKIVSGSMFQVSSIPTELYYQWLADATQIQQRNELIEHRGQELLEMVKKASFEASILKGHSVGQYYPEELRMMRQSGDIDVWIKGSRSEIMKWVNTVAPTKDVTWLHAQLRVFDDVEVEAHFMPSYLRNPFRNRKLQQWFKQEAWKDETEFNVVFILLHIFRHLFGEGIGLRQVMDWYFVLVQESRINVQGCEATLKEIGLYRFAQGMMWVLGRVFGLEKEKMYVKSDERLGKMILTDIIQSGNFGHEGMREMNRIGRFTSANLGNVKYMRYFPGEVLATPFFRAWHWGWKKWHGYQ